MVGVRISLKLEASWDFFIIFFINHKLPATNTGYAAIQ